MGSLLLVIFAKQTAFGRVHVTHRRKEGEKCFTRFFLVIPRHLVWSDLRMSPSCRIPFIVEGDDWDGDDEVPLCEHGKPCVKLAARNGDNAGREFYKCSLPRDSEEQCSFFQWLDGQVTSAQGRVIEYCAPMPMLDLFEPQQSTVKVGLRWKGVEIVFTS